MGVNKVIYNGETIMDTTGMSVTPQTLAEGETAINAAGDVITGTLKVVDEIITTAGSGSAYTATVNGIKALTAGVNFIMIPHVVSASTTPTLNVNGLGAKTIRQPLTTNTTATAPGTTNNWLVANKPVRVMYDGTYWKTVEIPRPSASGLYGTVPIPSGGTGATTEEDACSNLGVVRYVEQTLTEAQKAQARENIGIEIIPEYVITEAMSVLDKVVSAQGSRTFVLGAIADMHYGSSDYIDGVIHACQGMHHIAKRIKLDALAVLGDYTDEQQIDTETALTDNEEMNALLDRFCDIDNLRLKGNHDHRPGAAAQTYRYIMAHSDDVVWGSRIGGYFYRDFSAYKLRIIGLNTTETERDNLSVSDEQYKFFVSALDMSAKEDAEEWGILILSHHPLDWTVTSGAYRFGPILNAYQNGNSWTGGAISCNYSGKNGAKIVGNIHGHTHNLLTDKIYVGEPGNSAQTSVWRMCVPASRVDYVNHYSGVWVEDTWYSKTPNTADDTSFNIICIDLDSYTIKAFCYGAGYDRELTYYQEKPAIVNLIDTVGYQDNMRVNSSGSYVGETGYTSSGKIDVSNGDVIRAVGVNFDAAKYSRGNIHFWATDGNNSYIATNSNNMPYSDNNFSVEMDAANSLTITVKSGYPTHITVTGYGSGANLIVTKNQEITT